MREKLAEKLCSVYHDEKVLESYQMHDDKELAVQIVPEAAQADAVECEEMHFVMIKVWNPDTWALSEPFELWLPKIGSL